MCALCPDGERNSYKDTLFLSPLHAVATVHLQLRCSLVITVMIFYFEVDLQAADLLSLLIDMEPIQVRRKANGA